MNFILFKFYFIFCNCTQTASQLQMRDTCMGQGPPSCNEPYYFPDPCMPAAGQTSHVVHFLSNSTWAPLNCISLSGVGAAALTQVCEP